MIEWQAPDRLAVGGRVFEIIDARPAGRFAGATAIRKPEWCVRRYLELARSLDPERVVELGIDQGGSTVFFALVLEHLERLLALDIGDVPEGLVRFQSEHERGDRLALHGGVDQSDRARLVEILDGAFGERTLDLVVDDASHRLAETRVSFDVCLPRLRPGGVLVIEDWSWEHKVGRAIADRMAAGDLDLPDRPADPGPRPMPLSRLLLECVLVAAHAPEVISEVRLRRGWAEIVRGEGALDPNAFAVAAQVGWTGAGVLDQSFDLD